MLKVKKLLTKIIDQLTFIPQVKKWNNVATPVAGRVYELTRFTLKANSKYIILAQSRNGQGAQVPNHIDFSQVSGNAVELLSGNNTSNSGGGNPVVGFAYVETGSQDTVLSVHTYAYNANVTDIEGFALAIRFVGGGTA